MALVIAVVVVLHLGWPSRPAARIAFVDSPPSAAFLIHSGIGVTCGLVVWVATSHWGSTLPLVIPVSFNLGFLLSERLLGRAGVTDQHPGVRRLLYLKLTFVNTFYWLANIADYSRTPARSVLDRVFRSTGRSSDDYWAALIALQREGGIAYSSVERFLTAYQMSRNLANATNLILVGAGGMLLLQESPVTPSRLHLFSLAMFACFAIVFFVRYLFLFAGYYSRFILRYRAFLVVEGSRYDQRSRRG